MAPFAFNGSLLAFNDLATQWGNEMLRQQFKALNDVAQLSADQMHQLSMAKGLDDVMAIQSRFMAKSSPKFLGYMQDNVDFMMNGAAQYRKMLEKAFEPNKE
ncbi:MAG: phasin family protein [Candidatus Berkiella sp.]